MATPTPVFPAAVATDQQLKVANNLITTALKVGIGTGDTILFVNSTAGFVSNMLVSIDKEIIAIDSVVTGPNPSLIVAAGGRGFDGTSAATHAAGARVSMFIDAWHHNVLSAEVKAIETALGPNLSKIGKALEIVTTDYKFAPQSPGGTLAAGSQVITLAPVPNGVNGADANHWLYIAGGTGAAEAVLITGGTAVSGAASGTVIVTCANAHSGAWTIASATAGIQEGINEAVRTGLYAVLVPAGQHDVYAAATMPPGVRLRGIDHQASVLYANSATQDMLHVLAATGTASPVIIERLGFYTRLAKTAGFAVVVGNDAAKFNNFSEILDCWFDTQFGGIDLYNCAYFNVANNKFHTDAPSGTSPVWLRSQNPMTTDAGDSMIANNWFFGGTPPVTGIRWLSGGGLRVIGNKFLGLDIGINATGLSGSVELLCANNIFDNCANGGVLVVGAAGTMFTDLAVTGNVFTGALNGSFMRFDGNGGTLTRLTVTGNECIINSGTGTILNLDKVGAISVTGNSFVSGTGALALNIGAGVTSCIVTGNFFATYSNQGVVVAPASSVLMTNNVGIDDVMAATTISGSTLTMLIFPNIYLNAGPTTMTTFVPATKSAGQRGILRSAATVTVTASASITKSGTISPNQLYQWFYDGTAVWFQGAGF